MRAAAALFLLAISPAFAQTTFVGTRVSTDDYPRQTTPLPPLLPGTPVRILLDYPNDGDPPVATLNGDTVEVTETISLDPPLKPAALYVIDIGPQPAGTYHLQVDRVYLQNGVVYPSWYSRTFLVQPTPPSAPCSTMPPPRVPLVKVTPTYGGTVHLHFEETRTGHAPVWGVPAVVDIRTDTIDVRQDLADQSDAMATVPTCHSEDIDLGPLAPGFHQVSWGVPTKSGSFIYVMPTTIAFDWNGVETTCSTTPELTVSPGLTLSMRRMTSSDRHGPSTLAIEGNVITVVDVVQTISTPTIPPFYRPPTCMQSTVTVGALPPGTYVVKWQAAELSPPYPVATFQLIVPAPRSRAARH